MFTLSAGGAGVYVLVSTPRREYFKIPTNGCMHTSSLNHHITMRIPKRATDVDIPCTLVVCILQTYPHNNMLYICKMCTIPQTRE